MATNTELTVMQEGIKYAIPLITFLLGFFASRFTMSKKERKDHEMQVMVNAEKLISQQNEAFQDFTLALNHYITKKDSPDINDFFQISTKGELYFDRVRTICDAILANNVDSLTIKNSIIPKVIDIVERTLPDFYSTLTEISKNEVVEYSGKLERRNYESIYVVYEKYKSDY